MTVTFHRMKVGMPKAKDVCGKIFVEKIGIPPEAEDGVLCMCIKSKWVQCRIFHTLLKTNLHMRQL